jgi:hypothetical protein
MKRRKKNLYFGFGPASKAERARQRSFVRTAGGVDLATLSGRESSALRSEVAEALVGQGYKKTDAKKAAQRASGADFNSLFRSAIGGLKKNPRGTHMATKKRMAKKRKRNSRKGKMPAGLKAYWAKKRAAKAKRKNPRKRRRVIRRRRKPVSMRVRNFRRTARKPRRKSHRHVNPRRGLKIIRTNLRKGTKAFKHFVREQREKYGKARVL